MTRPPWRMLVALLPGLAFAGAQAAELPAIPATSVTTTHTAQPSTSTAATRNGLEIYARFREGLADPSCGPDTSQRWKKHFAGAPKRLSSRNDDVLPLFGYVVEALRQANLPTEYALIPFVESGYKPGARNGAGPAGLWQFIALTARNHHVAMRPGYDGRLSPIDSTEAAVRYLKTLHGMFAGDWRLAVMAFNAGEYRVFGALKRSGQQARNAQPEKLVGLSEITQAYVRKLHALSCVLDQADDREEWLRSLDRPVAILAPSTLPKSTTSLDAWAGRKGLDAATVKRINPAFEGGRVAATDRKLQVLAPATADAPAIPLPGPQVASVQSTTLADAADALVIEAPSDMSPISPPPRSHTVTRGDSIWRVARRYGLSSDQVLARNGLKAGSVLRPGMVLKIDAGSP